MRVAAKLHANVQSCSHDSLTSAFKNSYIDPGIIISMCGKAAASPVCCDLSFEAAARRASVEQLSKDT